MSDEPKVESIAVVANADGSSEEVYLCVVRTIAGQTVRYIEAMSSPFDGSREQQSAGFFVDCGLTYSGPPATVISGLSHLEGEPVAICADGQALPGQYVFNGSIALAAPAAVVHVGLPFVSYVDTLKPELPLPDGTLQARQQRIVRMWLRLHESRGGAVVRNGEREALVYPDHDGVSLYSGDIEMLPPAGWDRGSPVRVETRLPLPFTVLGLVSEVQSDD